jgi:hypothetical protein
MAKILNEKLETAIIQPYLKEMVLDRLTGKEYRTDNKAIIDNAVNRRMKELGSKIRSGNSSFTFWLSQKLFPYRLGIHFNYGSVDIMYGALSGASGTHLRNNWSFLQNYDQIKRIIESFNKVWSPVVDLIDSIDN